MAKVNTIGVDLAKNVIQSSVVSPSGKELQNKELTRIKFAEFLAKQKPPSQALPMKRRYTNTVDIAVTYDPYYFIENKLITYIYAGRLHLT